MYILIIIIIIKRYLLIINMSIINLLTLTSGYIPLVRVPYIFQLMVSSMCTLPLSG